MPALLRPALAAACSALWLLSALVAPSPRAAAAGPTAEPNPEVELERRLAACPPDDFTERLAIAEWASVNGLSTRAEALCRDVLRAEPRHEEAWRRLVVLSEGQVPPSDSESAARTRQALPRGFRESRSDHFIVFSNARSRFTREQTERLERAWHQFHRYAGRLDLRPLPLRHKLVCVLFRNREEYAEFAREQDAVRQGWIYGYYSPRFDRVVLFDGESEKGADEYAEERTIATTIHEAIHQLHFHTNVQTRHVQYPLWVGEGIATVFETTDPSSAFGPDHEFAPRRRRFAKLLEEDRLMPIRTLVRLDTMPDAQHETIQVVYSQSYALVSWLARFRERELRAYLASMLEEPAGRPVPERHGELFAAAFGDPDRVERAWLVWEREHAEEFALSGLYETDRFEMDLPLCLGNHDAPDPAGAAAPEDGTGTPSAHAAAPNDGTGTSSARVAAPNDGTGTSSAHVAAPNDGTGTSFAHAATPKDGTGTSSGTKDGTGTSSARAATPKDGTGTSSGPRRTTAPSRGAAAPITLSPHAASLLRRSAP